EFYSSSKTSFAGEVVVRIDGNGTVLGSVSEILRHGRCVHDLARIHSVFGIERGLDVLERSIQLMSEQLFVEVTTCEPSPCSPLIPPPNSMTRSVISSVMSFMT